MSEALTPLPHPLCTNLCSKKLHMLTEDREIFVEDLQTAGYETYWCTHTMTDTGPDGGWVLYDQCSPARNCFVPLERSTGLGHRYRTEG